MLKLIQLSYNCPHVTVSCEKRSELCFLGGMTCSKVKEGKESRPKTADCASFEAALPGDAVCRLDAGPRLVITIYIYIYSYRYIFDNLPISRKAMVDFAKPRPGVYIYRTNPQEHTVPVPLTLTFSVVGRFGLGDILPKLCPPQTKPGQRTSHPNTVTSPQTQSARASSNRGSAKRPKVQRTPIFFQPELGRPKLQTN